MRTRSQKIEQPAAAENPPNLPVLPIQENGEQNEEAAANEAPCSSRSVSTSENARASSAVANAGLIENVDDVTNRPCSSRSSPGVICISDSEDSDVLNPVCVDLTSAKTPNKSSSRAKTATVTVLNNTVIELDDSDDELSPARPPARSLNQNAPEKTKSTFGSALLAKSCSVVGNCFNSAQNFMSSIIMSSSSAAAGDKTATVTVAKRSISSPKKAARKRPKIVLKELVKNDENEPPKKKKQEEKTQEDVFSCNICMETMAEMKQTNKKIVSTPCGHVFCRKCLEMSAKSLYGRMPQANAKVNSCPKCRTKYAFKGLIELFV